MQRKVGIIVACISTILAIIGALSPEKVGSLRLGFAVFLFKALRFEIIVLMLIGILLIPSLAQWKNVAKRFWRRFPKYNKQHGKERMPSLILLLLIFLVPVAAIVPIFSEVSRVIAARKYFIIELLYQAYGQELYRLGSEKEENGELDKALLFYQQIIEFFPENPKYESIKSLIKARQGALRYANSCFEASGNVEKARGLNRQSFSLLVEAFRVNPSNEFVQQALDEKINELNKTKDTPLTFYNAFQAKDQVTVNKLISEIGWYLFDEDMLKGIKYTPMGKPKNFDLEKDCIFLQRLSAEEFQQVVEKSWYLDEVKSMLIKNKEKMRKRASLTD